MCKASELEQIINQLNSEIDTLGATIKEQSLAIEGFEKEVDHYMHENTLSKRLVITFKKVVDRQKEHIAKQNKYLDGKLPIQVFIEGKQFGDDLFLTEFEEYQLVSEMELKIEKSEQLRLKGQ